jgi:hypothetical protein
MTIFKKFYEIMVSWGEVIYEYRNSKASKPQ